MTTADRFWSKVAISDGCWEWTGAVFSNGYGAFRVSRPRRAMVSAHRFAWESQHGPIPADKEACHTCDNRRCVRLSHLFLGTHAENMADMYVKGRSAHGERHGLHRLTSQQVADIRARYRGGALTQYEIAALYGVSQSYVSRLVRAMMNAPA